MLSAILALAENREDEPEHMAVFHYLKACNLLFEEGILSKTPVSSVSSPPLKKMKDGFAYFVKWKEDVSALEGGKHFISNAIHYNYNDHKFF